MITIMITIIIIIIGISVHFIVMIQSNLRFRVGLHSMSYSHLFETITTIHRAAKTKEDTEKER